MYYKYKRVRYYQQEKKYIVNSFNRSYEPDTLTQSHSKSDIKITFLESASYFRTEILRSLHRSLNLLPLLSVHNYLWFREKLPTMLV